LLELLVSTAILLIISGVVTSAMRQMIMQQKTIWNRTEMHSSIRGATELLQQEVGQAGRIALPAAVTLQAAVTAPGAKTVAVSSVAGMFVNEYLTVDAGANVETVQLTAINGGVTPPTITATFAGTHANGVPVQVFGAFGNGIIPPNVANGSTATVLKLFGDVNDDGNMMYVEYTCDTAGGNLYRNEIDWNAAAKPALTPAMILLSNVQPNPGGADCFAYQTQAANGITDVGVTLTVQTQQRDPITNQFQTETKALLNVSPRNIFEAWQLSSAQITDHVQPTPASVTALLP
jgi:hypothetical protein